MFCSNCCVSSPSLDLLQGESQEADVLSVELDLTEWTDGTDALGGFDLTLAMPPTDAELLHSGRQHQTQVTEINPHCSEWFNLAS